ncbi:MAG: hypothetical protein JJ863_22405 [Deltaproteobacteria bacterium]|nr:hypothetical protein [Deltaproteobacteria bacterium]
MTPSIDDPTGAEALARRSIRAGIFALANGLLGTFGLLELRWLGGMLLVHVLTVFVATFGIGWAQESRAREPRIARVGMMLNVAALFLTVAGWFCTGCIHDLITWDPWAELG